MANWHRLRKFVHLFCVVAFVALPLLNIVRFDIPGQRFYFAGRELWISEFGIVFFSLMFLMFLVVVSSVFFGRVYCGYLCPQMIFSEASMALERYFRRERWLWYVAVAAGSVLLAAVFMEYFGGPGPVSLAIVGAIAFLDFTFLRLRFCTTACPYGYLQGMLGDSNTLLVEYRDPQGNCIECKKCVRVCPMEIDIRKSPYQIECVHCAECIDACDQILGRLGKPGLIRYRWGAQFRDAKRVIVLLVLLFYAAGLTLAVATRHAVLVRISPERGEKLYRVRADGRVYNRFRYTVANRSRQAQAVVFSVKNLPGAAIDESAVRVKPGESSAGEFEISGAAGREPVMHFTIAAKAMPEDRVSEIPMTFLGPGDGK